MSTQSTVTVLLVEDNEVDVEAVKRAFLKHKIANPVTVARDGVEALSLLRMPQSEGGVPRPCLVLLDLNMPRMNGLQVLEELRKDPVLKNTIVFVLTTSSSEADKLSSYDLNVAGYVVKNAVGEDFLRLTSIVDHYWRVVEFPPVT